MPPKKPSTTRKKRLVLRAEGDVQGVGFRWSARRIAERVHVHGIAENAFDGSVRLVLEALPSNLSRFCILLKMRHPDALLYEVEPESPATGLSGFEIR